MNFTLNESQLICCCSFFSLFSLRYTSIGQTTDTKPNPALKRGENYLPAYELQDETQERAGRILNENR